MRMPQRSLSRDMGICIASCFVLEDLILMNRTTGSHKNTGTLQELYKGCEFYSMLEDYYKQHQEEAEEIGLKIYRNIGVIDETTELEAYKIAKKTTQVSDLSRK